MTNVRGGALALALAVTIAACGSRDPVNSDNAVDATPASFAGFDSMALESMSGERDANASAGIVHYRVVEGTLDWYVSARSLSAGRAFRVVLTAADGKEYAIASRRVGADGIFAAHGAETVLMNRQCVATEDPSRRPIATAAPFRMAIKSDGSAAASASGNDLLGSRGSLPCNGNGDAVFDYVLRSAGLISLAP